MIYQTLLGYCGNRKQTEETLFDLLATAKKLIDGGNTRSLLFMRFLGLVDPLPTHAFHFYLFCIVQISKIGATHMFPELESNDEMVAAIPVAVCTAAANRILTRFCEGRSLKFYTERIEKTANSGFLRFGGKAIAEMDTILEYFMTAYLEEEHKIGEKVREEMSRFPKKQITSFSELLAVCSSLKVKPRPSILTEIMEMCLNEKDQFPIMADQLLKYFSHYGLTVPFELTPADFQLAPSSEDLVAFATNEFQFRQGEYEVLLKRLIGNRDEILVKQLRSAKMKFDQSLAGRSTLKMFQENIRELFEKIALLNIERVA
jgi:hypothetical protein